tara:strand:- start:376 stop:582 length:207 start_codon:yes stop_codon:yes gene_type:complete
MDKPQNIDINRQRPKKKSLCVKMYSSYKHTVTPDQLHGFGDYQCPLRKIMTPIGKKTRSQFTVPTQKA